MNCVEVREALPWYISGSIELSEAERIAAHLGTCEACRSEFVETAQLRLRFDDAVKTQSAAMGPVWRALSTRIGDRETFRVDLGSALFGLRLGIAASDARTPIRGDLKVCGRRVRILGKRKKGA